MSTLVSLLLCACSVTLAIMATCAVDVVVSGSNLKCSICLEFFSDPRVLPCLHTYCLKCLQGLVSDRKSDLSCPHVDGYQIT